jgi:hypothetical protein
MDGAAKVVVTFVPPSGAIDAAGSESSQLTCMKVMTEERMAAGNPYPEFAPWLGIDCLLDSIIGIKVPRRPSDPLPTYDAKWFNPKSDAEPSADPAAAPNDNKGMARGFIHFFFSGFQTSIVGIVLAVIGFMFILGTLQLIGRAFFIYVAAYIGIAVLVIASPLFIPLVLLPQTKMYFDKWVKLLISFAMQPVMMLAFIIMTLAAVDLAVFSGSYSIAYRIAGDETRRPNFDLNKYLTVLRDDTGADSAACATSSDCKPIINARPEPFATIKSDNATDMAADAMLAPLRPGGLFSGARESNCNQKDIDADTSGKLKKACSFGYPLKVWMRSLDWEMMAKARRIGGNAITPADLPDRFPEVKNKDGVNQFSLQAGQFILREVMAASFLCALIVFVMNGLMRVVPTVIGGSLGDNVQSANLANISEGIASGGGNNPDTPSGKLGAVIGSTTQGMKESISKMTGGR